ncbi:MAG: MATE family efflux transporter [Coriobacteriales bacterium]|jgi:putative MATE family efflux protein
MKVDMSEHFTVGGLLRFTVPSIAMMIFTSIYTIVDGLFVSNFAGKTAFASLNFIYPFVLILGTLGFMMGTGGSAIVARVRGEGDDERANSYFSFLVYAAIVFGVIASVFGLIFVRPVAVLMGATPGEMLEDCVMYGSILLVALPAFVLQYAFQSFFMTAGKPNLGFAFTVAGGVVNIVLDAILIAGLGMGLMGAAIGTALGMVVGGFGPIIYFARPNTSFLRLGRTKFNGRVLGRTCINGSSEMVTNIAMSVVSIVYNVQLMNFIGEDGVSAYGVIMGVSMIFSGVFIGYSVGAAPLMSFQYGAGKPKEMHSIFTKSIRLICIFGVCMFLLAEASSGFLAQIYVGYDEGLYNLTTMALRIFSIAFLLMGFNIYGSSLFTSLNNGAISAIISFLRSFVFEIGSVLLLPVIFGPNGIWFSVVVAEIASFTLTIIFELKFGNRYGFLHGEIRKKAEAKAEAQGK